MARDESLFVVSRSAPTGREARLWRVLVELAVQVDDAIAAHAEAVAAAAAAALAAEAVEPVEQGRATRKPEQGIRSTGEAEARSSVSRGARPKARPLLPGRLENLVVEFDDAYTVFVEGLERLPTESQMLALQAIDRQLAAMIRAREAELWTERALREDERWGEAQRLALAVIEAFAWPERRLALVG